MLSRFDNGLGVDPSSTFSGNRLRNMQRRAERIDGTIDITSEPSHGATLTLRLPLDH